MVKNRFSSTKRGKWVHFVTAKWFWDHLQEFFSDDLDQFLHRARGDLTYINVTKTNALRELQPHIPLAHFWYNEVNSGQQFENWDAWFDGYLRNRIYSWCHKQQKAGGYAPEWTTAWPGSISPVLGPPHYDPGPEKGFSKSSPQDPLRPCCLQIAAEATDAFLSKLSLSTRPEERLAEYQTGNPNKLFAFNQLWFTQKDATKLDKEVKALLKGDLVCQGGTEWYKLKPNQLTTFILGTAFRLGIEQVSTPDAS